MTSCLKTTNFTVVVNCLYYRNKVRKVYCSLWTTDDGGSTRSTVTLGKRQLKYKYWREFAENFHELLRMPLFGCLILCCCSAVVGESVLTEAKIQAGNDISYKMFFFFFLFYFCVCFFLLFSEKCQSAELSCCVDFSILRHAHTLSSAVSLSEGVGNPRVFLCTEIKSTVSSNGTTGTRVCCEGDLTPQTATRSQMMGRHIPCWAKMVLSCRDCESLSLGTRGLMLEVSFQTVDERGHCTHYIHIDVAIINRLQCPQVTSRQSGRK